MTWQPRKGTVEIETPFCGELNTDCRSKTVPSIITTGQYKDFQWFPDHSAIWKAFILDYQKVALFSRNRTDQEEGTG